MPYLLGIKENNDVFFKAEALDQAFGFFQLLATDQKIAVPREIEYQLFHKGNEPVSIAKLWVEVSDLGDYHHQFCYINYEAKGVAENTAGILESLRQYEKARHIATSFLNTSWNDLNPTAALKFLPSSFAIHSVHGDLIEKEEYVRAIKMWHKGFENVKWELCSHSHFRDLVELQWIIRGTHQGYFGTIAPTGKEIELHGVTLFRIAGDFILEAWTVADMKGLMVQLESENSPMWNPSASILQIIA